MNLLIIFLLSLETSGETFNMSKQQQTDWNESNIIDDVAFQEEDAKQFKNLLDRKEEAAGEGSVASDEFRTDSQRAYC